MPNTTGPNSCTAIVGTEGFLNKEILLLVWYLFCIKSNLRVQ